MEDEGSATDCDLTLTGPDTASDSFGKYYSFVAANSDIGQNTSCSTPPATVGVACVIYRRNSAPSSVQTPFSWGDADDAFQVAAIDILNGSGVLRAGLCQGPSSCNGNLNAGPWSATDNNINMLCVRQSDTINDVWMNGSGWQTQTWSGTLWTGIDQVTVGALGRQADTQYADADIYTVFTYASSKSDAEMATIWNSGDPWSAIGIDPTAGGEPLVPGVNVSNFETTL